MYSRHKPIFRSCIIRCLCLYIMNFLWIICLWASITLLLYWSFLFLHKKYSKNYNTYYHNQHYKLHIYLPNVPGITIDNNIVKSNLDYCTTVCGVYIYGEKPTNWLYIIYWPAIFEPYDKDIFKAFNDYFSSVVSLTSISPDTIVDPFLNEITRIELLFFLVILPN